MLLSNLVHFDSYSTAPKIRTRLTGGAIAYTTTIVEGCQKKLSPSVIKMFQSVSRLFTLVWNSKR